MSITLEQAFHNVDNVVADAPMNRAQHAALIESLKIIKEAAYPKPEDDGPSIKEPVGDRPLCDDKPEDKSDGGTDSDTDN